MNLSDKAKMWGIFIFALALRFVLLPYSQTVHADAVSRVFIAVNWLGNPHYITDGYWGPLHHYLNALSIALTPGWIIGPKLLNILLGSLTVFPLFGFTKNVFKSSTGATIVALIYVLCPVLLRNSFQALAGVSYGFFVVTSMYYLSKGFSENGKLKYAALGGLFITFAAATRYEAWVIIACFTLVGVLMREWRFTAVFWLCAMIFPGPWMIGNQIEFGDFLYSVNQNDVWNIQREGINDNVNDVLLTQRLIFFPMSFAQNISPIAALMLIGWLIWAAVTRSLKKEQLIWLVPFVVMAAIFIQKAYAGTLMMQHRFITTWIVLLLPFLALVFVHKPWQKLKAGVLLLSAALVVPMSFWWMYPQYTNIFGEGNLGKALEEFSITSAREMEGIPLLRSKETEQLNDRVNEICAEDDGFVLDFVGWDRTFYLSLNAPVRSYITDGAKHGATSFKLLEEYLANNPNGLILLSRVGRLNQDVVMYDSILGWPAADLWLKVEEDMATTGEKLLRYEAVQFAPTDSMAQTHLFPLEKDVDYFKTAIEADQRWYNQIKKGAYWEGVPLDSAVAKNARYMVKITKEESN